MRITLPLCLTLVLATLHAETHTVTLPEAIALARIQNPDVLLAYIEARKADEDIRLQQDAFYPKVYAGSGLAYTSGFPMSIEGSAPSVVQARAVASVYNRSQKYLIAEARETAHGAAINVEARQRDAVMKTIELYLDAAHARQIFTPARDQADIAARLVDLMKVRVQEGREIPLETRRAELVSAQARQVVARLESNARLLSATLAQVLGYPAGDEVIASMDGIGAPMLPENEAAAVEAGYRESEDLRRIDSELASKRLAIRAAESTRLPRLNLVAQYGLLAKFNNYAQFFNAFQRHNGQLGVSIEVPLWAGPAAKAQANQAAAEIDRLHLEANRLRTRIALDIRRDYTELSDAEMARNVARLDLDVAREALDVSRSRLEEGRITVADVERARQLEAQKWLAYYDAVHAADRARYALAERTGMLQTP